MVRRLYLFGASVLILLSAGCSSGTWDDAITASAPSNPHLNDPKQVVLENDDGDSITREVRKEEGTDQLELIEQEQPTEETSQAQPTTIVVKMTSFGSCHNGAVRCYLNRRYVAQFDEDGEVTIEIEKAGQYTIEAWDSSGHWLQTVNILPGQMFTIEFSCDDKKGFSEIDHSTDETSGEEG